MSVKGFVIENNVLTKYEGTESVVTIPDGVTHIGDYSFKECKTITEVFMPDSVVSIGKYAFNKCVKLKEATVSKNLEVIETNAFEDCKVLKRLELPNTMKKIEYAAFAGCVKLSEIICDAEHLEITSDPFSGFDTAECKLLFDKNGFLVFNKTLFEYNGNDEIVAVPDGVTHIYGGVLKSGAASWEKKLNIKKIILPDSVTHIGRFAFANNTKLAEIVMPSGVEIEVHAFDGCTKLADENGLIIFNKTACTYVGKNTELEIPAGVECLADELFKARFGGNPTCDKITKVILPEGLKHIGRSAFMGCTELREINIPKSVEKIDSGAFCDCVNLAKINVPESTIVCNMAFNNCNGLADKNGFVIINDFLYQCFSTDNEIIVPENVKAIGTDAFSKLNAEKIILPPNLKVLGAAFKNCEWLKEIDIPEGITSIEEYTFEGCKVLTCVDMPDSIIAIESSAFKGCEALETINIPQNIIQMGRYVFTGCSSLKEITIPSGVREISSYMFDGCTALENVTIENGVEKINYAAFRGCSSLKQISSPESVMEIEFSAFENCTLLEKIAINNSECKIDSSAFKNCPSLFDENGMKIISDKLLEYVGEGGKVVVPDNVKIIGPDVFREGSHPNRRVNIRYRNIGSLSEITLPSSLKRISTSAFRNCQNLSNVTLSEGLELIDTEAFAECSSLKKIDLPLTVKSIGSRAFSVCSNLETVHIPNGVEIIQNGVFDATFKLSEITVEPGNKNYSSVDGVLYNADGTELIYCPSGKKINEFTVPEKVETIADRAFADCFNLEKIVIGENVKKVGSEALPRTPFYGKSKLKDIKISVGAGSESTGENVIEFPYGDGPLVYPTVPVDFPKEQSNQIRLVLGFCLNPGKYSPAYAEEYKKYAISHQKTIVKKAQQLELKAVEKYFESNTAEGQEIVKNGYKPDLSLKKPNELQKVEILEEVVVKGTLEDLKAVLQTYKTFELTARALGLAARYRGVDFVRELMANKATFKFKLDTTLQRKYNIAQKTAAGYYMTEYYLMIVPEKLSLNYSSHFGAYDYDYTPMCGVSYINGLKELEAKSLSFRERLDVVKFLMEKKPTSVSFDEMLFWALLKCEFDFADALIEMGVNLNKTAPSYYTTSAAPTYIEMLSTGKQSAYWMAYVTEMTSLKKEQLLPMLERLVKLASSSDKKLLLTQKMFDELKWSDESLAFALKNFDVSKINQGKAIEKIISENEASLLDVVSELGWFSQVAKLDKALEYAQSKSKQEVVAWVVNYKNKKFDVAAEETKTEAKLMRELTEDPNSVSALKKIWSYKKLDDGSLIITSYKGSATEIEVPATIGKATVSTIDEGAFAALDWGNIKNKTERKKIVSVVIPEGVTKLEKTIFRYCDSLEKVVLPSTLKGIKTPLVADCKKLVSINIPSKTKISGKDPLFLRCDAMYDNNGTFITEDGKLLCHKNRNGSSFGLGVRNTIDNVTIPDSVTEICDYAFYEIRMKSLTMPDSVEKIGKNAFERCDVLESLSIHGGVKKIGTEAFSRCYSLKTIQLSSGVVEIGSKAFASCGELRDVYIPKSVEKIGDELFGSYDEPGQVSVYGVCVHTEENAPVVEYLKKYSGIKIAFDYDSNMH